MALDPLWATVPPAASDRGHGLCLALGPVRYRFVRWLPTGAPRRATDNRASAARSRLTGRGGAGKPGAMQRPIPQTRDVVLLGGGHTHALVLRMWGMDPLPGVRLTVINPGPTAPYSGMLPGHIAGHYTRDALDIDLVRLARFAGARVILGTADGIDLNAGEVQVPGRPGIGFDLLSLDIGIHAEMPDLPGFAEHGIAAKPLDRFAGRWAAFGAALGPEDRANAVVIGGGVAGVELAMAMSHHAAKKGARLAVTVADAGDILSGVTAKSAARLMAAATGLGVTFLPGTQVARIEPGAVVLADGTRLASDFTLGAAGARPWPWLAQTGLALADGFVAVDARLQSATDARVFAVGDCAHLSHAPRPKAGVYAVREAPVLNANLRAALGAGRWRSYRPQKDYLKLISLGGKAALADKAGVTVQGGWLWRIKDRIDRNFMEKFRTLAPMAAPAVPRRAAPGVAEALAGPAPCGGCGAKVGPGALAAAIAVLPRGRADVETGAGDDAAILKVGGARLALTADHLRAVTLDPYVMARIAARHALGDVLAMGAEPQAALASLILPPLAPRLEARALAEIMAGASEIFGAAGAEIVGGHTSAGAEMTLGFTVTGLAGERPVTLAGAMPGDGLILTHPIGSGTLMAAEMRLEACGADVATAWAAMQADPMPAARALRGAHAMTDVTGFGLAGHLLGMLDASGVGASLKLAAIPLLPGAEALAGRGIRSTLWPANAAHVAGRIDKLDSARAALLCDPQTAGGFLAALAPEAVAPCLSDLRAAGLAPAIVGEIAAGPPRIRLL